MVMSLQPKPRQCCWTMHTHKHTRTRVPVHKQQASAVVTDIELSFPTAGSTPKWPTKTYPKWVPDLPEGHNKQAVWSVQTPARTHAPPTRRICIMTILTYREICFVR